MHPWQEFRLAVPADVPAMHALRLAVRENVLTDPAKVQASDYLRLLATNGRGWVAIDRGQVIGFAMADARSGNIWALFVRPGCEGLGVGRRLQREMLAWLFSTGVDLAWLTTEPGTRAERFYRRAGWREAARESNGEIRFEIRRDDWAKVVPGD